MESKSTMDCLDDFINGWEGVQQFEDSAYLDLVKLVTPSSPAPVEQAEPSCDLQDLEEFLDTAEKFPPFMPYEPSLEEEIFLDTLDDIEFMELKQSDISFSLPANDNPPVNDSSLNHLGTLNRQELHTCVAPPTSATDNAASKKPDVAEGKPYIKKPPNAFMLFRAEQRQNVANELQITNSSKVNVVLGQKWKMMSKQEQAPYYEQAYREKRAHKAMYPGWSAKENFGKKVKRRKVPYQHHFAFPVAPVNQQPVMTWPYATVPMSFPNQALNNQDHSWPFQKLPEETIMIDGIPVHATPFEAFLNQAHENQAPIKVLPIEGFTTPGFAFQDLSNQAPPCNPYEVFLNMAPEDQASIQRLFDQPATKCCAMATSHCE